MEYFVDGVVASEKEFVGVKVGAGFSDEEFVSICKSAVIVSGGIGEEDHAIFGRLVYHIVEVITHNFR